MQITAEKCISELPDDVKSCHDLILELAATVACKDADIACLKERLQNLLREKFGRSTEKLSPGQLSLFQEQLERLMQDVAAQSSEDGGTVSDNNAKNTSGKHGGGGRKPLPKKLPRERKDYFPDEKQMMCLCGQRKHEIGIEVLEQLDYVPASFKVIEHVTHKFACRECQEAVVEGTKPKQVLSGSKAAEGLIAQISVARNADHQPLHRQEQTYAREGVDVARSSMGRWLDATAQAAKPIYERIHQLILQSRAVQADESPVRFIDKTRAAKKSKTGYVWALYGDKEHPYTLYDFQPDRTTERAKELLDGFNGLLLTDGYGGYEWYHRWLSANCNVHARRYFEKAQKNDSEKAGLILALYTKLYQIESRIRNLTEEQIVEARQAQSVAILNQMRELMEGWQASTPPKTALGVAINYALPRFDKLSRFTEFGVLQPDTNLVENSIRPIAVGRKNWLHIGSEEALETASIHATLVNSCKRLNVNPYLYLRDIFIRLGQGEVDIDSLLPDRWKNENPID